MLKVFKQKRHMFEKFRLDYDNVKLPNQEIVAVSKMKPVNLVFAVATV